MCYGSFGRRFGIYYCASGVGGAQAAWCRFWAYPQYFSQGLEEPELDRKRPINEAPDELPQSLGGRKPLRFGLPIKREAFRIGDAEGARMIELAPILSRCRAAWFSLSHALNVYTISAKKSRQRPHDMGPRSRHSSGAAHGIADVAADEGKLSGRKPVDDELDVAVAVAAKGAPKVAGLWI